MFDHLKTFHTKAGINEKAKNENLRVFSSKNQTLFILSCRFFKKSPQKFYVPFLFFSQKKLSTKNLPKPRLSPDWIPTNPAGQNYFYLNFRIDSDNYTAQEWPTLVENRTYDAESVRFFLEYLPAVEQNASQFHRDHDLNDSRESDSDSNWVGPGWTSFVQTNSLVLQVGGFLSCNLKLRSEIDRNGDFPNKKTRES